jgi:hypothetical protein
MRRSLAVMLVCGGLAACAVPGAPPIFTQPGDLAADRAACNQAYAARIGNYLPHAQCVNAAVERDAIPSARYPDLVRLQEQLRLKYSALIDQRVLSPREGERKMTAADAVASAALHDRDSGRSTGAEQHVGRLEAMLQ